MVKILKMLFLIAIVGVLGWLPSALANDSAAAIGIGGLELKSSKDIRMVSEVLKISPNKIDITYIFRNESDQDITEILAFPLPELHMGSLLERLKELPKRDAVNFVGFRTWVDGREIEMRTESRSYCADDNGTDEITQLLTKFQQNPVSSEIRSTELGRLLVSKNCAYEDRGYFAPQWSTKTNFIFKQIFPVGKSMEIRHSYEPVMGFWWYHSPENNSEKEIYCEDSHFLKTATTMRQPKANAPNDWMLIRSVGIEYILTTGANWAGPIGDFTLILDKADSKLLSTCPIPGLSLKKSGNGFIAKAKNYVPTKDLKILYVYE